MRIRIIQKPDLSCVDGIRLTGFLWGLEYDVNATLGAYLIAQGWATSQISDEPEMLTASEFESVDVQTPVNLRREQFPPYYDGTPGTALDRRRRSRE